MMVYEIIWGEPVRPRTTLRCHPGTGLQWRFHRWGGFMAAEVAPDDRLTLDQQICFTLAVAYRDVVSLYRPLLEPLGLTHPQYLMMVTLWEHPETLCVKDLSALLKIDAPTLSPLLKRMEGAGLICRERNPADERSVQITLTPHGRELRALAGHVPASIIH